MFGTGFWILKLAMNEAGTFLGSTQWSPDHQPMLSLTISRLSVPRADSSLMR